MTTGAAELAVEIQTLTAGGSEQNSQEQVDEAVSVTAGKDHFHEEPLDLLSVVLARTNMQKAYARVMRSKGAAGVDGFEMKAVDQVAA